MKNQKKLKIKKNSKSTKFHVNQCQSQLKSKSSKFRINQCQSQIKPVPTKVSVR